MNRIYRVIFNRSRGLYQVVSEIAKRGGKEKSSRTSGSSLRRGAGIALCIAGIIGGTLSVHAEDDYVLKTTFDQAVQHLNLRISVQERAMLGNQAIIDKQIEDIGKKVDGIDAKAIADHEALSILTKENGTIAMIQKGLQENKTAIDDITKDGGKLDQTINQVNTMVGALGDSMTRLQNKQNDNSGEIARLKTAVADITKAGGVVDTNKKAIAQNATDIKANNDQIGKNTQALDALNGPNGTIAGIQKDIKQNQEDIKKNSNDLVNAKTELGNKIDTTKSDLENKITTDIGTAKTDLENKIKKAQEDIGNTNKALDGRVSQNATDIQGNKEQIGKNTQALDALNGPDGTIAGIKKDIKQNKTDITQNKEDIKNLKQTVSDNKDAADNALKTAKEELNKTIGDNKTAAETALATAKSELNKTIGDTKTELSNKIDTTKSDLEKKISDNKDAADNALTIAKEELNKTIGDNKAAAETALTTAKNELNKTIGDTKNELSNKIDTTKSDLEKKISDNKDAANNALTTTKNELTNTINTTRDQLSNQIRNTNNTVATNKRDADDKFKKIENYLKGNKTGQNNLGLDLGETGKLGFRYFRTSMDNKHDADPQGANSMAIGISTTSGDGSIGIAAGGPAGALTAGGENSIGIGNGVEIGDKDNANTIAIGTEAKILKQSEGAIAIGNAANIVATNKYAIAIGAATQTFAEESMALGHSAKTYMKGGVAIGQDAQVGEYIEPPVLDGEVKKDGLGTGIDGIAIGRGAQTLTDQTITIGADAGVGMKRTGTIPLAASHIVIGTQAGQAMQGMENIALGYKSGGNVQSNYNISIGSEAGRNILGSRTDPIGKNVSIGYHANFRKAVTQPDQNIPEPEPGTEPADPTAEPKMKIPSIAEDSQAIKLVQSTAIGSETLAANNGTAVGYQAQALGNSTAAYGFGAIAEGESSLALGTGANAKDGNIALGAGSIALKQDVENKLAALTGTKAKTGIVSVGNAEQGMLRRVTNVGDAVDEQDAVTLAQLRASMTQVSNDLMVKAKGELGKTDLHYDPAAIGGDPSITLQAGDNKTGTVIHNVAKGVHAGDAVNLAQLKEYTEKGMGHYFSTRTTGHKHNFANEGATGENSVAFGVDASATNKYSAAMGNYVQAQGEGSLAIGTGWFNENDKPTIEGTGEEVQPVMTKAYSGYRYNVAIGAGAQTEGNYSMAIGPRALTKKKAYKAESENTGVDYALSIGYLSTVYAKDGLAIGHLAEVHQPNGVAIGSESWSLRNKALAIGNHNTALGRESGTMGTRNGVSGDNSYVIGNDNMNLTDDDRKDVLDTIANAATKGISDNDSTVLGNRNTMVSKFKSFDGLDGKTSYQGIVRGEDNHIVGNANTLTRTNNSFVTGSTNELVETTSTFLVGSDNKLTNTNTISGVLGEKNEITSHHTTTLGNANKISGDSVKTLGERNEVSGANLAVIGNDNTQVAGEGSNVFGNANTGVTTENGHVIGFSNNGIAGTDQQVLGSFNDTINAKKSHVIGFTNTNVSGEDQRVIGNENDSISGNRNTVLGNKNKDVTAVAEDTQLIGNANASISAAQAQILGNSNAKISTKSGHVFGNMNSTIDGEKLSVIGDENSDIAGTQSLLFGYKNKQVQKDTANTQIMGNVNSNIAANRTQIIGNANKVGITKNLKEQGAEGQDVTKDVLEPVKDAQIMGNNNQVQNNYVQVLGNHITTTLDQSVYLGDNAAYNEDETLSAANKEYTKDSIYGYDFAGTKPVGVVTVGAKGNERRLQNVAAGLVAATSTDAVNGSQLYQLTRPLHFAGDNSTFNEAENHDKDTNVLHRGSNQNITIKGGADVTKLSDNNIGVAVDPAQNTMNVKLAKNLTDLETITFGKDGTSMKIDGTNQSISNIKKVTFGAPDSQNSMIMDGENKVIKGLSNTTWIPKDKRDATFDRSQAATQGQLEAFEKSTQRGFDVYVNKDEDENKFTVQLGDEKKNDAFGFLAGNNLTVSKDGKQITYALKDDLAVGKEGQDGKDGSLTVHGKEGETVAINGKDGNVTIESAKDGDNKKNTITMNGKDGTVGINGKDGATVVMNGDGTVVAKGKGEDGKPGASVTIDGKNGITTIESKTDDNNQKNTITLNGKDGKMGVTGKDGSNVTLNGQDGSIGMNGKNGTNAVSITTQNGTVGVDGQDGTTRLVVKEGTKTHEVATMNDGMKFMGDVGTEDKLKLNEQLTVTGGINDTTKLSQDNNIGVIADGQKKLTLRLAKNIQGLDTITLGDAEAPMKIDGTNKTISRIEKMVFGVADSTDSLIMDGKEKVITGLSNTTLPDNMKTLKADQAATQGQLKEVLDKIGKNIDDSADYRLVQNANNTTDNSYSVNGDGDINLTVQDIKHPEKKDTVTIKDVAKKSDLTASDKKFTDYAVKYDKEGDTVNKNSITLEGNTTTGTVIKNVGAGSVTATSKDAVNGSQLYKTNQGFDVYVKDKTDGNTFDVQLGSDTKDAFGFDAGNGLAITRNGKKIIYSLQDDVSVGKAGQDGKDGKITVNGKDGESVTINGKNGEIGAQGPKGDDGKANSVTISGKDGTIGTNGKDGSSVVLNGKDGSIGMNGKDGKNAITITTGDGKVGLDGTDGETRIIVKDGNKNNELATMNDGLKFKGDDGNAIGVKLNKQVNIVGGAKIVKDHETITNLTDNNIGVESIVDETDGNNAKMKIRLAKNLSDLESITFNSKDKTNPMKIDGDAKTIENIEKMTFGPSNSTDSITVDGEHKVITGLSNTTLPTDLKDLKADQAASQGQLSKVLEKMDDNKAAATDYRLVESDSDDKKYSVGTNGEVTLTVQDQNHKDKKETVTIKDIAKKSDLDTATKTFTDYAVKYDKNGDTVNKNSITLEGGNDGTVIKNVKAGDVSENSKDAVNGSQLYKTNQNVTNITNNLAKTNEGFDILVGEDTADNRANVALGKNNKETVEFAAGNSLEVTLDKNAKKVTYSLKDDITVGKDGEAGKDGKVTVNGKDGEKVTIDGKDGKIESKAKDGTTVTVNGKDGTVGAKGTDGTSVTMNGKDGTIGGKGADGTTVTMNAKDGTIGAQGPKGANGKDGASVTINGKDGTTIINGATDENGKKNTITLNGKDGTMGVDGKDGNSVTLNGQDGSIGMKGKDGTNAVSITTQNGTVGVDGKDGTTRLVVKEGTKTHELATMNDGMKFMGDVGTEDKLKLNEQLTVTGGITDNAQLSQNNNIGVIANGQKNLTLRLAKELKGLDSITFGAGDTAMKIDGTQKTINNITKMTFKTPDNKDSIVVDGTKKVITGLSNTTLPEDMTTMQADQAASQGQLNALLTKVQTEATDYRLVGNEQATDKKYTVDANGDITLTVQDQNHKDKTETVTIKDVAKKSDLTASDKKFTDYAVKYDKKGDTVNKDSITLEGDTTTGTVIKNVGAGSVNKDSKEAVNGSQLYKTNQGFDVYIKDNSIDNTFNVKLGDATKDAFGFDAGNGLAITRTGKKIIYSLQDDVSIGKAGQDGKDGKITVNGKDGESVTIKGKNGEIGIQGPKGADGKSNSVTLSGKDGTIGVQGPTGADGKDGNSVTLNGKDGSIGIKGKDGENKVDITTGNGKVGLDGTDGETRIIVKDGNRNNELATMNDGLKFQGDDGNAIGVKLNKQVNIVGGAKIVRDHETITNLTDNNIGVESIADEADGTNAKMKIRLAKNLSDLEGITFNSKDKTNPMKIDGDAKTIENIKKMTFGKDGSTDSVTVDGEQKVITGLSNTTLPTDLKDLKADQAASQGQLKEVLDKATATDDFSVKYDKKDNGEVDKNSITLGGDTNGTVIKNVKAGDVSENSKEAINGSQLYKTNQGFDILVGQDTADNRANVALGKDNKETVEFAAGNSLDVTLDKDNKKVIYSLKDDIEVGKEGQSGQTGKDGKVTVNGKDGEKVTIDGKDGKIESKAKDGTTVTVNGKDGTVGATGADGTTVTMNGKDGTIGATGADGTTVTVNGKNGTVGAKGTDGTTVTMNGKDGTIGAQGPKGTNGKDGASVTINGKDGITTITGATDDQDKKNIIALNGKDGKMGVTGKDGNSVTLNGQDGSIGMKGKDGTNAVSITTQNGTVGVDGKDGTTRLVVKEGTKTHEVATMNDGMKFMGDVGTEDKLKLNEQLTVTGGITNTTQLSQDNNIGVIADGNKNLTLRLAKELKGLDSITFGAGDTAMKIDGAQKTIDNITKMNFKTPDNKDSIVVDGTNKVITGLSNTTLPKDMTTMQADQAASQGQLNELLTKVQTEATDYRLVGNEQATDRKYTVDANGDITLTVQDQNHKDKTETVTIKDVAKKSDLTASDKKFTDYAVKYDKKGDTVNKDSITLEGNTTTGTVIKNVGAGSVNKDSKEAVNGSQLYKTNQGFDVYIKDNTDDNAFNVKLGDDTKDAFGFDAGNGLAITRTGKKIIYSLQDDVSVGKAGQDGKDGKITVNGKDGESVTINGKNGEIGAQGSKGDDGKSNSVTISGKDGTIGTNGKDGSSVVLNGKDGSIGMNGKDGKNAVTITTGDGKVGLDGKNGETRIIVKEGNHVNEVATMNDGLKFKGDDGTAVGVKLNNQVNIVGGAKIVKDHETITNLTDNNIGVESIVDETDGNNAKMKIRLAKNLSDLESITFNSKDKTNPMKIDGDAKTIENIKKMTFGKDGSTDSVTVDGEHKVITGLSNTTLPTDLKDLKADQAASQGQLKEVLDKATATDDFSVKYDKKDTGEVDKNSITLGGDTNGTVIKNVKAGDVSENSKEAINGSQLYKTNQGFDILVGQDTADNRANVALGKDNKETVEFAAGNSLEVTLDKNAKKVTYSLKDDIEVGKEGQPGQTGKDGKVTVNGKDGEKVTIDGKDGKIESKAKDGTTVTVNGKDGTIGATGADGTTVTVNGKDGTVGAKGTDGTAVTMNGKDGTIGGKGADGTTVTMNAKEGTIGAQGPKGANGKDGAAVTINGKDGITTITGATDDQDKKNIIALNGKDGKMGVTGKDGNSVTLNGQDGSIDMKGKDGKNAVNITTKDGTVGVDGQDGTTRIVVKDGDKTNELATMNDGMKFMGDFGTEDKLKLNEQLAVTGGITDKAKLSQDDNIGVEANGAKGLILRLAKELKGLDGITFGAGDTAMKIDGTQKTINNITKMTFKTPDNKDSIVVDGTNKVITGLSNTTLPKDMTTIKADQAASQGQLKEVLDNAVKYDKKQDGTVDTSSITLEGGNDGTVIKNVKAGDVSENSKEAINGSQLYKTNQGFDVYIKDNSADNTFNVKLGDATKDAFGFDAGNGLAITRNGKKISYALQDDVSIGKAGQDGKDGKITVNGKDGESVTIKGKNGEIGIQGPKGDNGKSNSITISGKDGTIGTNGKDGSSVVLNGKDGSIGIKGKDGDNKVDITTGNGKVGLDGTDGETRIIVKDGNKNNELATMNDGLKFKGDDGNAIGVKLNKQVNIVGGAKIVRDHETITNLTDNNIGVESIADEADGTNAKMKIRLAKNLSDLESITFNSKDKTNPMVIDGAGRTIKDLTTMTFLKDGKNNFITGLSNVTWPAKDQRGTDFDVSKAATQGQIQDVENAVDEKLKKSNQGFDILVGEDTEEHRANIALGKDKKETVEFAAGNSLDVTLDKDNKKVIYSLKDDIEVGKEGQPGQAGKDGKVTVNGKDGEKVTIDGKDGKIESKAKDGTTVTVNGKDGTVGATGADGTTVTMNGKDGTIGAQGPKGANGKDGASVTINGKDGITTITGATDDKDKKNVIALDGKDGKMGITGKDGNSVTLNGQDGSIDMKGKDGKNAVNITTKDGTVGVDGQDGTTRIVVKDGDKTNELATMNDGMKFMGDFGTEDKLKLNEQLAVTGGITDKAKLSQDDNIGVEADGAKGLILRLAKELKGLDGITFGAGDTAMKIDGTQKTINNITKMTFKTPDNKDSIVVDGTDKVITGLSNTTLPKDMTTIKADQAASQGQLKEVLDNAVKYDKKQDGTVDTSSITLEGGNDGTVIKNVKAGDVSSTSKEAVNGSQLYKTNQGFDILVGEDTEANRANVALGQDKKETVKFDAGKNLTASLDKASKKVSYRLNDEIVLGEEKTADATGINGKITIHGTTGEKMTMDGKNGEVIIETTDENGKKNEVFLKSHDGTMGVIGKENNGVTLHGEGFVQIKGAGSDKAIDLTTEKGQVGVDGQGSSTRLLMKEGNVPHALATMDDGLKFMGDSGTTVGVKLNNQINIVGGVEAEKEGGVVKNLTDNNIGVESIVDDQNGKNAKMKIRLAKKLSDLESITFNSQDKTNPMTIDGAGRTIKDLTTMTFLKDGKNNFITGLSNVTWPDKDQRGTDFDVSKAATQGQIQDVETAVDEKFKKSNAGFDVYIKEKTDENTFNIGLGKDEKEAFGFLAGNGLEITRHDKEITYAMKDDITLGHKNSDGQDDGKDGKFTVTGKDGNSVTVDGKDGKLTLASATDDKGKTNQIVVNGKDGSVRGDGKSGNAFEMNADAGTVGAKGADGSAVVLNGNDGTIDMNGKDGKNKVTIGTKEGKVGIDGTDGTTRVVVKEGDKVNELATMNDGLKFKGDSGDVVNRKLNETLSIEGGADPTKLSDKNIGVVTDAANGKMLVKLAKDLKDLTSVETKDDQGNTTNMTGAGVTTKDDKGNTTATTATGMTNTDAAGHETNTTASGVVAKDKDKNETSLTATGTVVKDKDEHETSTTATGVVTKDKDGNQTTVSATSVTTEDKDKNTNVSTAKDITVADKDGNKTVINKEGMTITHAGQGVISLTKDGLNNGGKTITGVATGVNDTDAVNVKQLKDEIEKNRTKLEGSDNIAVSGSGKEGDPFKVALKDDITLGHKNSDGQDDGKDGKFTVTGKDGNSVTVDGKDGKLTLASATDDKGKKNQIALNGKDGTVSGDGKSGNAFEMNADAGTVSAKGADGSAVVLNGKDGTIDMNGKDGKNKVTIGTQEGKVGIDGTNGTTRVVVKEGDKTNELATMNDGLKFKSDSGDVVNRKLNETLSIEGGADTTKLSEKNIGVVTDAESGKMSVKLAKDLKDLTTVETKDDQGNTTNMTGAGTTTKDNKGNTTTTNATGVTTTDGKGNTTTTTVDGVTTTDGKGNTTVINKGGITIKANGKNDVSLTDKGLDNGGNKLTSITDGDISKDSKDAVNGGQLYKTNQGFDVLVGEDKAENRANVALGKDTKETIEFAAGNGLIATIDKDTKKITYAMKDTIEIGKKGEKDGKLVVNGKDGESITMNGKDGIVETKGTDGTTVTMNGKDGTVGATGKDGTTVTMNGKDGTIGGKGADGTTVTMNVKDGTISAQGPKGADGKDGASVTINGKDGTTTINGATDKDGKKNTISLNGKDGKMGVTGKDGNSVTLNGQDGSIGMKGKDGKNTVQITTKDGKVGVDGKDGETRIVVKDGDKVNELATMNDGLKFKGDSGDVVNRKLNETLSIEGGADPTKLSDKNIGVVTDAANGKMLVKLAKEIKGLDRVETKVLKADNIETKSMTMGDVTVNENGLTIKNGPAVTKQGINAGGKAIHNVAPGVIAPNSLDAVNGGQLFGTEMRVAELGGRISKVGAGAAALAGLHPLDFDPDNKWDFAASYGNYSGNSAFALGAYYRPSESSMISFGGTVGNDRNMYNVGVSLKMGSGENNVTGSRIAMAREIIDLRKENDGLKGRLDAMERKMNQVLTQLDAPKDQLYTPAMYPDTPDNHWAYEYIKQLQAKNMLGAFQNMANKAELSRHEMAQMIYAALKKGAPVDDMMDRALSEFENEIRDVRDARIRVDRLKGDVYDESIDRVRVNPVYDTKQSQANV